MFVFSKKSKIKIVSKFSDNKILNKEIHMFLYNYHETNNKSFNFFTIIKYIIFFIFEYIVFS